MLWQQDAHSIVLYHRALDLHFYHRGHDQISNTNVVINVFQSTKLSLLSSESRQSAPRFMCNI